MILSLTSQEIAQYRSQLANYPEALESLDIIEDCEGDLEDAAVSLAIHAGQQPDRSNWLDGLAKRCRVVLCQDASKTALLAGNLEEAIEYLIESKICPPILATPVIIYVIKTGVSQFCQPLNLKSS